MVKFCKLLLVLVFGVAVGYTSVVRKDGDVIPGKSLVKNKLSPVLRVVTMKGYPTENIREDEIKNYEDLTSKSESCQNIRYTANAIGDTKIIRSPNFPHNYPGEQECSYFVSAPENTQISLKCDINIRCKPEDSIFWSLSGDESFEDSVKYCGKGTLSSVVSSENKLAIGFRSMSDAVAQKGKQNRWTCRIQVVEKTTPEEPAQKEVAKEPLAPITTRSGSCTCGKRNIYGAGKVVGGTTTRRGEIPWRVTLFIYDKYERSGFLCGGTIINRNWVLTAAHCTMNYDSYKQKIAVYAGAQENPVRIGDRNAEEYDMERYVQHAGFNRKTLAHDIALIKVSKPIAYRTAVGPACLPTGPLSTYSYQGAHVLASGWGTTNPVPANAQNHDQSADTLQKLDLPVLTYQECSAYPFRMGVNQNQICTYEDGRDTCQGDSGGSIDYQYRNGLYYAIGVVSYGIGCAQTNYPGVYTFVPRYLDWIGSNTPGEGYCQPHM